MRLVRSVQVAIGFAASSGMVFVLSGSALAADGGADTSAQSPSVVTQTTAPKPDLNAPVIPGVDAAGHQPPVSQESTSTGSVGKTTAPKGPAASDQQASDSEKQAVTPVVSPISKTDKSDAASKLPMDRGKTAAATSGVVLSQQSSEVHAAPVVQPSVQSPDAPAVVAITTLVAAEQPNTAAVTYRTTVLKIKPTITSRVAATTADLAAAVPSAPVPARAPSPTQPSGVLGSLTAQLALTLVPQPLNPDVSPFGGLTLIVNLATFLVLLINVFTFTYGLWLRRGGFATAARSDTPTTSILSVATPFLSGYASLPLRLHSPLLSGGRNEILKVLYIVRNDFRKEERS